MSQFLGQVVGTKMQKTVKVCVSSLQLHPVILKYWNHKKVYFAHDESEKCKEGDYVLIKQCQKISKKKWYRVIDIVEAAQTGAIMDANDLDRLRNEPQTTQQYI